MSEDAQFKRAKFRNVTAGGQPFDVHFNPASLSYAITNNLETKDEGGKKTQFVGSSTGKLTMDLVFDTTHDGQDVRVHTAKVSGLMKPDKEKRSPPVVEFAWGVYTFQGVLEGYKETLDFFAPSGIPLRAAVNLTLSSQDTVFDPTTGGPVDVDGSLTPEPVKVPTPPGGAAQAAAKAGDPRAARALAAANGLDSLRFGGGAGGGLSIGAGVKIGPPAGGAMQVRVGAKLNPAALLPRPPTGGVATDRNAIFGVGGKAHVEAPASLRADVGNRTSLNARIRFGG